MREITVSVTDAHIAAGRRGDCVFCPVALALRGAGFLRPLVAHNYFTTPEFWRRIILLPLVVTDFIRAFDSDPKSVQPFTFTVQVDGEEARP